VTRQRRVAPDLVRANCLSWSRGIPGKADDPPHPQHPA